jgi:DNA-directed RNA polymerase subunit N (RpoN/RPB10)
MNPRHIRIAKAERYYNVNMETFIERVRKARALGCNLSYLGIDNHVSRRTFTNRVSVFTK